MDLPEEWRAVVGYEGRYGVSSLGRVQSYLRRRPRILRLSPTGARYLGVSLCAADGNIRTVHVHTLVCEAFHGPCPRDAEAAHADGDRLNNRAGNLAWKTPKANADDKRRHGRMCMGDDHGKSKLTSVEVQTIRALLAQGESQTKIATRFGVKPYCVYSIAAKKTWAHLPDVGGAL